MLSDIGEALRRSRLWLYLAYYDIKVRYRGSFLGPIWLFFSFSIFILAIGFVYQEIFKADIATFMPYLATGVLVWNFMSAILQEAPATFVDSANYITSSRIPLFSFILRSLSRQLIIAAHQLPAVVAVLAYFGTPADVPMFLLGLLLVLLCLPFIAFPLAAVGARFRDLAQLVPVVLQLGFLVTPVLWTADLVKSRPWIYEYNVLHHFISVLRDPLNGRSASLLSYAVVAATGVLFALMSWFLHRRAARRVAVWVG